MEFPNLLKFSPGKSNAKLIQLEEKIGKTVYSLSLLSGHSCPFADKCLAKAIETPDGRRIWDGPNQEHRCYSASQEVFYTNVYNQRNSNFDLLKKAKSEVLMTDLIEKSLPECEVIRIHAGGDYFNNYYFRSWINVARNHPDMIFYAYTKSLPYWLRNRQKVNNTENLVLTASFGGKFDHIIKPRDLRYSIVVGSKYQARKLHLPVDHNDFHAYNPKWRDKSFALIVHGPQQSGTQASKDLQRLGGLGGSSSYSMK